MSKFVIGLTGGIGSGKTTIANMFAEHAIDIIDADIIAREVVQKGTPALRAISEYFGANYLLDNGELNRALLRKTIFSNDNDKNWLNNLLHPLIRESIVTQATLAQSTYCIIVAPLLIENNLTALVDRVLVIDVHESTQLARTTTRDGNTSNQVQAIIDSQVSRTVRLEHADDVLNNNSSSLSEIRKAVESLHQTYLLHTEQKLIDK